MTKQHKYSVACDFDGVIHSYTTPWSAAHIIPDPPVAGAIEWLEYISKRFTVIIFTTRGGTTEGRLAVRKWLEKYGFENHENIEVTNIKPPALVYVDDRAWRFEGRFPTVQEVHEARPWHKRS